VTKTTDGNHFQIRNGARIKLHSRLEIGLSLFRRGNAINQLNTVGDDALSIVTQGNPFFDLTAIVSIMY